jgi:hypothetical protein
LDRLQWDSFDWLLSDGDLINVTIEHNVASSNAVDFVLESGPFINWWKAIALPDGQWIYTQDARKRDTATVAISQLHGDLQLGKAKFLGVHQGVYLLDSLERLQAGDRVTFSWLRDGAPWRNDASIFVSYLGAPVEPVQSGVWWVRPGSQFPAAITVTNAGDAWYPGARYKLGSWDQPDNLTWGLGRIELDSYLSNWGPYPNHQRVDFTATAPAVEGEYSFAWRMVQEGVMWFGNANSVKIAVAAVKPTPAPPPLPPQSQPPPPPPPSAPKTSGEEWVTMTRSAPGVPSAWYLFNGMAHDPALHDLSGGAPGRVVSVKNGSQASFSLAHQDPHGNQTVFVNLGKDETTSAPFENMEVEGDWSAQFSGTEAMAPTSLTIRVSWHT